MSGPVQHMFSQKITSQLGASGSNTNPSVTMLVQNLTFYVHLCEKFMLSSLTLL